MFTNVLLFIDHSISLLIKSNRLKDLFNFSDVLLVHNISTHIIFLDELLYNTLYLNYFTHCDKDEPLSEQSFNIHYQNTKHTEQDAEYYRMCIQNFCDSHNIPLNSSIIITDQQQTISAANTYNIPSIGFMCDLEESIYLQGTPFILESFESIDIMYLVTAYHRKRNEPVRIGSSIHLYLQELTSSDIPLLHTICRIKDINTYVHDMDMPLQDAIEFHTAYIDNVYKFFNYGFWGIFLNSSNKLIGRCGLQNVVIDGQAEIEIGYLLDVNYHGLGYAKESATITLNYAFNTLCLSRVIALIHPHNYRSKKTALSIGMMYDHDIIRDKEKVSMFIIDSDTFFKR